jgi:hypothetical protein
MARRKAGNLKTLSKQLAKAARRVGHEPGQQARWLLAFAWCDLNDSKMGPSAPWELRAFLWIGSQYEAWARGHPGHPRHSPPSEPCSLSELGSCQALLREGLRSLVYEGKWLVKVPATLQDFRWTGPPWHEPVGPWHGTLNWTQLEPVRSVAPLQADTTGLFCLRVYETLRAMASRFRVCEREKCRKPFIARKRQAYCSRPCSQAVRTRRFRARDPERVRKLRRRTYERTVRARSGSYVKIATNRRPQSRRHPLVGTPAIDPSGLTPMEAFWHPQWRPTHWWQPTRRAAGKRGSSGK